LDVNADQLEMIDYELSKIEDDAFSAAEKISYLGQQTETYSQQSEAYNTAINDILGRHGLTAESAANMTED
jgi:hypothetical protein